MEEQAQAAYEALREQVHGVSPVSGKTLPPWGELDSAVTNTWVAAVQATEDAVSGVPPA